MISDPTARPETLCEGLPVQTSLFDSWHTVFLVSWYTAVLALLGYQHVLQIPCPLCPFLSFAAQALLVGAYSMACVPCGPAGTFAMWVLQMHLFTRGPVIHLQCFSPLNFKLRLGGFSQLLEF